MFLKGKRALVTGSTSGIGLAIARALTAQGASVVLNGFGDDAEIAKLCEELGATHSGADLTDAAQIQTMMEEAAISTFSSTMRACSMSRQSKIFRPPSGTRSSR